MTVAILAVALVVQTPPVSAEQVQEWFEAGQDMEVVQAAQDNPDPRVVYLAGLAYARLEQQDSARERFESLATRDAADAWAHIGRSAVLLNTPATNAEGVVTPEAETAAASEAEQAARQAVEIAPTLAIAHYQLGLVRGRQNDYAGAAVAFDAATEADPRFAYAHYYGGLSHYQNQQTTQMAISFENFLRVAPNAPERGQVESIMRTLRGR
jgi:lipoprotein NlpI